MLGWGIETATGLARHIRDLCRDQTGSACGIECAGCGRSLEAVNAGVTHWKVRPHFRHPAGFQRADCHLAATRLALVDAITHGGILTLPARRRHGSWIGLSGTKYEVWRNLATEQVRVRTISYTDRTRALITLDDGRRLAVMLRGEFSLQGQGAGEDLAFLTIEAGANAHLLSELSPDELRERLTLVPDLLHWQCHWQDAALSKAASDGAREQAQEALDEWPVDMVEEPADRRRETLLHRRVREILAEAMAINVPGWQHEREPGEIKTWPSVPAHRLSLTDLRAERSLMGRVPDIQCAASADDRSLSLPLLAIEVVVHNDVTDEKLDELRIAGAAVLAVSFKHWGGCLTPNELRRLVLTSLDCKQWLHHPLRELQGAEIEEERARAKSWEEWRRHGPVGGARAAWCPGAAPDDVVAQQALLELGRLYRLAAIAFHDASRFVGGRHPSSRDIQEQTPRRAELWVELSRLASELADLGAPGGRDEGVLMGLMTRLLSIRENRGFGVAASQNARAMINHVWTEIKVRERVSVAEVKPSPGAALAVIAFRRYELKGRNSSTSKPYDAVRAIVHRSLTAYESRFLWDPLYVPLIRAVFPELADDIDALSPRMARIAERRGG